MNKSGKWLDRGEAVVEETRAALQIVYDSLNQGQRDKLLKNEKVLEIFDRYGLVK